jgi:hypothetical protein
VVSNPQVAAWRVGCGMGELKKGDSAMNFPIVIGILLTKINALAA